MTAVQNPADAGLLLLQFAQQSHSVASAQLTIKVSPDGQIKKELSPALSPTDVEGALETTKKRKKSTDTSQSTSAKKKKTQATGDRKKSVESVNSSSAKAKKAEALAERKRSVDSGKSNESNDSKKSNKSKSEPKPLAGVELLQAHNIGFSELSALFHLSINEAAKELGVCATVLKRVCRKHNIVRWPQRKIRSLDRCIESVEKLIAEHEYPEKEKTRMIRKLGKMKQKRQLLLANPNAKVNLRSNIRFNPLNPTQNPDGEAPQTGTDTENAENETPSGSDGEDELC